jgi:Flp pilus assembly protein TadD
MLTASIVLGTGALIHRAAAQSPSLETLSTQGQAALRDQQFDRAQKVYEQIVKLEPRSAEAHSNLGFAFYMNGN